MSSREPITCQICHQARIDSALERRRGHCDACAATTGLWLEPPGLRPTRPCIRCGHTQFVYAQLRERAANALAEGFLAPLALTMAPVAQGYATSEQAKPWAPMGILVAFACRSCGLTEIYTLGAAEIPIGREYGTHLVDVAPIGGPMR